MASPRQVGAFELLEPLGAGGMGEVFKARDRRLNRFVAIKFLPESAPAAARERFQREALAIAALNHPNICTLYEAGEQDGQPYLVMELLEGETLFTRLQRGPVAVPQLAQWGGEIADALQAAHAKGILHRDLKPANIFITQRGSIKVLDFGLAQFALAANADAATLAGTLPAAGQSPLTHPGTTLGTYAYMSPEQARGEPTDTRSDIFSCGVVLYEMAGGQPPFRGRTSADLTAAILMLTPPPPSALRTEIPPRLDDIIAQCLEKDPDLRYQSATELRVSLRRVLGSAPSSSTGASAPTSTPAAAAPASPHIPASPPAAGRKGLWSAAAAVVIAGAALAWWRLGPQAPARLAPPPVLQFRQLTFSGQVVEAAISPDGKFLAHVDAGPQGNALHLLSIASGSDVQIVPPGGGCCQSPSFAPDGGAVYFLDQGELDSVPVLGGTVRTIATQACDGAAFSPDGSEVAYVRRPEGKEAFQLVVAHTDGTQPRVLAQAAPGWGYASLCWAAFAPSPFTPAWSADGGRIAVLGTSPGDPDDQIQIINSRTGQTTGMDLGAGTNALGLSGLAWLSDDSGLLATIPASPRAAQQVWLVGWPGGQRTRLTNDLQGYADLTESSTGALALLHSAPQDSLWVQAAPGSAFVQLPGGGADRDGGSGVAWTPQGGLLATRDYNGVYQLWAESATGSGAHALALTGAPSALLQLPVAAASGQIVFQALGNGTTEIWRANLDGNDATRLLLPGGHGGWPALVHGGQSVAYLHIDNQDHQTLWAVPLAGGAPHQLWPGFIHVGGNPASPDGNRIFVMGQSPDQGYVPELLQLAEGKVTATPVAFDPKTMLPPYSWTPDGRALTFIHNQGSTDNLWAFPLNGGKPYAITHFTDLRIAAYAFSRDGRLAVSRGTPNSDAVLATGLVPGGRH